MRKNITQMKAKKRTTILNTVVFEWLQENSDFGYWTVYSPIVKYSEFGSELIGADTDKQKAYDIFVDMLDTALDAYYSGRMLPRSYAGQPKKEKIRIAAQMAPEFIAIIKEEASSRGISQGEMLEFMTAFYRAGHTDISPVIPTL
jgi:hypothetical protein